MKKILLLLAVILTVATGAYSQAPGIFNYQGVARNSVGNVLINQAIALRLTIHDGTAGGPVVYQEVRGVTTNPFGLFNAQVGSAGFTSQIGTIAGVPWGVGNKYIQVEIDPNGGSTFINIGTAQIASVPYSLYTTLSGDLVLPFIRTQSDNGPLFKLTNSANTATSTALEGLTNSIQNNVSAIIGTVTTASAGGFSAGVRGINNGNAGNGIGVWGSQNGTGWGVYGTTPGGIGVYGLSTTGVGTQGTSTSGNGVNGTSTSGIGVFGTSNTGNAGVFTNTNAANTADALQASTNGTGSSWALRATSTGLQGAGIFVYNNSTGAANALRVTNNGSGAAISALATNSGSVGTFTNNNAGNTSSTVVVTTNSTTGVGLQVNQTGTSQVSAVYGNISTTAPASAAISGADFSSGGASGIELRTFAVVGQTGTTGIAVGGYANSGGTALRGFGGGLTGYALSTNGRVQLAGIGEINNWILKTDAVGNATWANPAILLGPLFWSTTGNTGNVDATNFIGNIDNVPFNIRVNNQKAGRLDKNLDNTFYGLESGSANYTSAGRENTGIGVNALNRNTTGNNNTGIGSDVLYFNTTGTDNTAIGRQALYTNTTGSNNTALGRESLISNTTGNFNTASGWDALYSNTTGSNNTGNGYFALVTNTTGSNNTAIGYQADVASVALTNATAIGANASVSASNSLVLGNNANVGIGVSAPGYKLDIDATGATGIRVRNTSSFATVDVFGVGLDQAVRFGKNGALYSGINTLPDGDHINFFKFGVGNLMALNVNTGNLGVGGAIINPVAKVHVRGFNVANNLYSSSTGFLGATGLGVNDVTAQPTNEKWGIHTFVNGGLSTNWGIFAEPGTTGGQNAGLFGRVSTAPAGGQSYALFAFDPVNNGTTTWAANIVGRMRYADGTQGLGKILKDIDGNGNAQWSTLAAAGIVAGSGTLNYVPKWTPNGVTLGNSQIFDDGINVGIGTATPLQTLQVSKTPANPAMGGQLMLENAGVPFASNTVAIDFVPIGYAFSSNIPGGRITAFDDGAFSSSLLFYTKTPGASGNPLAERMRISSGGNVGVGTTVPNTLFANNGINNLGSDATGLAARSINWSMSSAGYVQGLYNGSAASGANGLEVKVAGTTANNKILDLTTGAQNSNGNSIMVVRGDGNVGINNASPANKLDVSNANLTNGGNFDNTNAANNSAAVRGFNASINSSAVGVHGISESPSTYFPIGPSAVVGQSFDRQGVFGISNNNTAVHGASNTGIGVVGESYASTGNAGVFGVGLAANNFGVVGNAAAGTGAGGYFTGGTTALRTLGAVQLTGIGEANGYVLTSNAVGNATWQAPPTTVAFKRVGGSANLVVNSGNSADINTWNVNEYNLGGGAYNAGTGEYTVPVTGLYQVYAKTKTAGNAGTGYYNMNIRVNGVIVSAHTVPVVPNDFIQADANSAIQLNAGDIVKIQFQNSSSNNTTILNWVTFDMEFSINRIK